MSQEQRAERVRRIAHDRAGMRGPLLPILHAVQHELGHLEREDVVVIADVLNLSIADVHGVVSFYHDFRTSPRAEHEVIICRAEACQAVGAHALYDEVSRSLADDPQVQVREVFCLGNCALGPSGTVDGRLHGRLDAGRVAALLQEARR